MGDDEDRPGGDGAWRADVGGRDSAPIYLQEGREDQLPIGSRGARGPAVEAMDRFKRSLEYLALPADAPIFSVQAQQYTFT